MLNYEKSVEVAEAIMEAIMEETGCAWYTAFETLGGCEKMEEAGVCQEVIDEYAGDL